MQVEESKDNQKTFDLEVSNSLNQSEKQEPHIFYRGHSERINKQANLNKWKARRTKNSTTSFTKQSNNKLNNLTEKKSKSIFGKVLLGAAVIGGGAYKWFTPPSIQDIDKWNSLSQHKQESYIIEMGMEKSENLPILVRNGFSPQNDETINLLINNLNNCRNYEGELPQNLFPTKLKHIQNLSSCQLKYLHKNHSSNHWNDESPEVQKAYIQQMLDTREKETLKKIVESGGFSKNDQVKPFLISRLHFDRMDDVKLAFLPNTEKSIDCLSNSQLDLLVSSFSESEWNSLDDQVKDYYLDKINSCITYRKNAFDLFIKGFSSKNNKKMADFIKSSNEYTKYTLNASCLPRGFFPKDLDCIEALSKEQLNQLIEVTNIVDWNNLNPDCQKLYIQQMQIKGDDLLEKFINKNFSPNDPSVMELLIDALPYEYPSLPGQKLPDTFFPTNCKRIKNFHRNKIVYLVDKRSLQAWNSLSKDAQKAYLDQLTFQKSLLDLLDKGYWPKSKELQLAFIEKLQSVRGYCGKLPSDFFPQDEVMIGALSQKQLNQLIDHRSTDEWNNLSVDAQLAYIEKLDQLNNRYACKLIVNLCDRGFHPKNAKVRIALIKSLRRVYGHEGKLPKGFFPQDTTVIQILWHDQLKTLVNCRSIDEWNNLSVDAQLVYIEAMANDNNIFSDRDGTLLIELCKKGFRPKNAKVMVAFMKNLQKATGYRSQVPINYSPEFDSNKIKKLSTEELTILTHISRNEWWKHASAKVQCSYIEAFQKKHIAIPHYLAPTRVESIKKLNALPSFPQIDNFIQFLHTISAPAQIAYVDLIFYNKINKSYLFGYVPTKLDVIYQLEESMLTMIDRYIQLNPKIWLTLSTSSRTAYNHMFHYPKLKKFMRNSHIQNIFEKPFVTYEEIAEYLGIEKIDNLKTKKDVNEAWKKLWFANHSDRQHLLKTEKEKEKAKNIRTILTDMKEVFYEWLDKRKQS